MATRLQIPAPPARPSPLSGVEAARLKDLALGAADEGITISDVRLPDNPIVYANDGFARLTG